MYYNEGRLLTTIDCTQEQPADRYITYGNSCVVNGPAGRYREAEAKPLSRFGYRFRIENIGKPHVMVIRYPDDKRRFMFVVDSTSYDLATGIVTGCAQPLTRQMLEIENIFWPRWEDCSITFMTWGHGEPAAAASIQVYELDNLPALDVSGDPGDGSRRELGIQYEDPCGTAASEGAISHDEWVDRVVTYCRHTGQKLLAYPICWYHGPQYPSEREPADASGVVVARDRRLYVRWTTHPSEWLAPMLERFGREGLEFQAVLTMLRLGSLMQKMNIDLDAIKAGADTFNNMLWNDNVQAGTLDWTTVYNARNFEKALEYHAQGRGFDDFGDFPYLCGEKRTSQPYHFGPMFNPLHPVVEEAIIGFVEEIANRYGRYPAFKGIAFNMWTANFLWFASIHSGYDDYTIGLFEEETGIRVPVDTSAPDRFSKRYEFLTYACRNAWVDWRCRKIRELVRKIRDKMVAARADLCVTLNMWNECYIPLTLGSGGPQHQLHARPCMVDLYRDAGIDVELYRDEPGIELDLQFDGGSRDRSPSSESPNEPIERFTAIRDHDFLEQKSLDAFRQLSASGVYIFNAWHEAWGDHKWFYCEPDDEQAEKLAVLFGEPAEGIFRMNCTYPEDGFWWDSQMRITPAFPSGQHFMEQYAHAVAEIDALRITRGGLFLDKAHGEEIARFARAFRALPKTKFETVGTSTDPVAVRTLISDDKRYFYLQNRDYYPVSVDIIFTMSSGLVTELGTGESTEISDRLRLVVGPYELRSFSMASEIGISEFVATPPVDVAAAIRRDAEEVLQSIESVTALGRYVSGMDEFAQGVRLALEEGRIAWLRRAVTSYIAQKSTAIVEESDLNVTPTADPCHSSQGGVSGALG